MIMNGGRAYAKLEARGAAFGCGSETRARKPFGRNPGQADSLKSRRRTRLGVGIHLSLCFTLHHYRRSYGASS